jgi:pimeloyl-ACP methyl ester carboxylesterase
MECASIEVPVEQARPDGATFALRLGRLPNTDPARKRGSLLMIPGGPGLGIKILLVDYGPAQHVEELRRYFDVISFDPRGIERSRPLRCAPALVPPVIAPFDRPPTHEEFDAAMHAAAAFYRSCIELTGDLMNRLSAIDTAGDIERIRQALGQHDGLIAYGASYGSGYGAAYLERYGDRVNTLVLDGILDHSVDLPTFMTNRVLSVQASFDRFARWCARQSACALHGRDVGAEDFASASAAIAASSRRRSPTAQTPMSFRSSAVRCGNMSASILLSRNFFSYSPRPRPRSHPPTSMPARSTGLST